MNNAILMSHIERNPELLGQTVVVIGGSAGIGLETARKASAEGAKIILTGRSAERLQRAASEVHALSTAAFDATDPASLARFFDGLQTIDHVMVTAGRPYYGRLADMDFAKVRGHIAEHLLMALYVARYAAKKVRPRGTLIFMGGTVGRRPALGMSITGAMTAALPALTANLALEIAPVRVNLIAAGFVDTPLSAELLGDELENRRNQLREKLPIRRVVGPADVAALAVHIMSNTALTGATYDIRRTAVRRRLAKGARMSTIHLHQTTTLTPEQYLAGLTDFGPGRAKLFGNSADEYLKVHSRGPSEADVTEGSGSIWERLHYDWSDPNHVVLTTTDSNTWGGASGHTYTFTRNPNGTTDIDVVVVREGKNLKGWLLGFAVGTIGKSVLEKAFVNSVKAIEARTRAAEETSAA